MGLINKLTETVRSWWGYGPLYDGYQVFHTGEVVPFVSGTTALGLTPVYRATTLISNDIARTPVEFLSSSLQAVWERPNAYQSGYDFVRSLTHQALLYGNAFALINRRRNGDIYELLPLPIGSVTLDVSGKTPVYITKDYGRVDPNNILHIKASLLEGLWANSPINLCRTAIQISMEQENNVKNNASMGGLPNLAIIHPGNINSAARQAVINEYMKNHTGKNAGRPMILAEGVKIEKLTSTSIASDLDLARKYSIADVSRIYGVPLSYLSEAGGAVYGSLEWLSRMYLDSCLSHWYESWSSEFQHKLGEAPLWDTDFIVRPSLTETFAALRTGIEAGIITRNEARAMLDYDPVEDGDEFLTALNLGTGGGQTNIGTDTSDGTSEGDIA